MINMKSSEIDSADKMPISVNKVPINQHRI